MLFRSLIDKNSQVLDVGCGDGILMDYLIKEKKVNIRGIEISKTKVQNCIAKGLTIIEGNAEEDLKQFPTAIWCGTHKTTSRSLDRWFKKFYSPRILI